VKKLGQRAAPDRSQKLRGRVQLAFLLLNVFIGAQFYLWVRAMESGQRSLVPRPPGVEGWLPIAALMNLKAWILTGAVPQIHPAGMFLLVAFLGISLLLKKAFCGWICPVGTISEWLWKRGRRFAKNIAVPKWLDIPLRGLKYLLFAFFAFAIVRMPADDIAAFMASPYGVIADVKLLNFFRHIGTTGLVVVAVIALLSLVIQNFWCRYLCPYGALLGIVALVSPARIRRDADLCIDCAKCRKACPARLPVDVKPQIRSAECTLCMLCVASCPAAGALQVKVTPKRVVPPWAIAAAIGAIFLTIVLAARLTGHWRTNLTDDTYSAAVRGADEAAHPMP
jgi:polyferredoxin